MPREGEAQDLVEVWWSGSLLLPLRFTFERGGLRTTTRLEAFTSGLDNTPLIARLDDPRSRFPSYEVLDVSDLGDHRHRGSGPGALNPRGGASQGTPSWGHVVRIGTARDAAMTRRNICGDAALGSDNTCS